jgi:hypothetical protein
MPPTKLPHAIELGALVSFLLYTIKVGAPHAIALQYAWVNEQGEKKQAFPENFCFFIAIVPNSSQ